jgi:exodeoxyribonuclease-3
MKIFSWNINGIRAAIKNEKFLPFVEQFEPDVLCLQETKAMRDQVEVDLEDYDEYWNSAERKGYSGTAIFTKKPPEVVFLGIPDHIATKYKLVDTYGDTTKEGRVLTLEFEGFFVSTVYTPNAKDNLTRLELRQQWDQAYFAYMKELETQKPVIFCGDLNVAHTPDDLARPKENEGNKGYTKEERAGFESYVGAGFVDTFRSQHKGNGYYTWWSHFANARERNVGWRIDYVLMSEDLMPLLKKATIHPDVFGSDHCPVSVELAID